MKSILGCASLLFAGAGLGPAHAQVSASERGDSQRVEIRVHIDAPADTVWRAFTNPRLVKQWFLGVDTETDWRPGSRLIHRGVLKNNAYEAKGIVLESERPKRLVHTHWSAISGFPDRPENYQTVRYELTEAGDGTLLTLTEENIPGEEMRKVSEETWRKALRGLKAIAERRRSSE